jgi:hypothetical protein
MKQAFTRQEVIELFDIFLECGDILLDVATNEHTDYDGEACLEISEEWLEKRRNP